MKKCEKMFSFIFAMTIELTLLVYVYLVNNQGYFYQPSRELAYPEAKGEAGGQETQASVRKMKSPIAHRSMRSARNTMDTRGTPE
jgi:hypothetical protein